VCCTLHRRQGHTWPTQDDCSSWKADAEFSWPAVPAKDGGAPLDWTTFPRGESDATSHDLCTLRIQPKAEHGWLVAEHRGRAEALVYVRIAAHASAWLVHARDAECWMWEVSCTLKRWTVVWMWCNTGMGAPGVPVVCRRSSAR
jgi:hypothetical protein